MHQKLVEGNRERCCHNRGNFAENSRHDRSQEQRLVPGKVSAGLKRPETPENRYWKTVSGRQEHMRVLQKLTGAALLVYIGSRRLTFYFYLFH